MLLFAALLSFVLCEAVLESCAEDTACGDEKDDVHLLQMHRLMPNKGTPPDKAGGSLPGSDEALVKEWVDTTLGKPNQKFAVFNAIGGFSSQRNEMINAMVIAQHFGRTVVVNTTDVDRPDKAWTVLSTAYDLTKMRAQLLRDPETRGFAFVLASELAERNIRCNGERSSNGWNPHLPFPVRTRFTQNFNDMHKLLAELEEIEVPPAAQTLFGNADCQGLVPLDGASGWRLDVAQCHLNSTCAKLVRAFAFHPQVEDRLATARSNMQKFLVHGNKYTCLHLNTYYRPSDWLIQQAVTKKGANLSMASSTLGSNSVPTELLQNILIVSQDESNAKVRLREHLQSEWGWNRNDVSIFTLGDLEGRDFSRSDELADPQRNLEPEFILRGAVSSGLCMPGQASSYIGEYWSGFTWHILARTLVDGPFDEDNFTVQIYGPWHFLPDMELNYITQLRKAKMEPPPWVHIVGYDQLVCDGAFACNPERFQDIPYK
eukprot:gnl/TRDRNA2_/TRDRNA2_186207_c0_seq1.p1 gnl/TRDRNA2_/TRDRNA2_186207_c0~~gnl/TRDRNA2_/TRDRNA2_186207_c0_seq1.p1  ORF type:complete len:488 (-),score=55.29 gnl/TRDRNA2_/TRDRNA2_186207_c0_seq1:94-1557(-)